MRIYTVWSRSPRNGGHGGPHRNGGGHHAEEAAFVQHLRRLAGRQVTVQTTTGILHGRLVEVFPDHVLLRIDGREHHLRIAKVVWVSPNGNGYMHGAGNGNGNGR